MQSPRLDFEKSGGLIPVVVQKCNRRKAGKILMLAYANSVALELTIATGLAHFWSRSRNQLWKKGETSGNALEVMEILLDCDGDALVYRVVPQGPVCHTGQQNCFVRKLWRKTQNKEGQL